MSFGGLILTNAGRNELIRAEMGTKFELTHVVLGEGRYNGTYTAISSLVNKVMEIPITRISRTDDEVLLECDFNSVDVPKAFYLREIGIMANGALCYYDNSREDAEYIDPESDTIVKQKRMRFVLLISSEITVNVKIESTLYALAADLEKVVTPEYTEAAELAVPDEDEDIWEILGKSKKAVRELIGHLKDKNNPHQITVKQLKLEKVDNTADMDKPVSTAQQEALDDLYQQLTAYTRQKISELINGADSAMDTLKEVEDAIAAHKTVMDALDAAIGKKANAAEFDSHVKDTMAHITNTERNSWEGKLETTGDASNVTATFDQATVRANLASKEKLSVSMGKIMKWFADLASGAASTLLGSNLTKSRALISNASGKVGVSSVTATELGYLSGVTSAVQDQIDELNTGINRFVNYYVTIDDDYQFVQITARKSSNLLILQGAGQLKDLSSWIVNGYNSNFDKKSYSGVLGTINAAGNYLKLPEATISGKSINGAVMMPNWLIHFPGSSTESKITTNSQLYMAYANGRYYICWVAYEFTVPNNSEFTLNAVIPISVIN